MLIVEQYNETFPSKRKRPAGSACAVLRAAEGGGPECDVLTPL